jgi:hypothetical protein
VIIGAPGSGKSVLAMLLVLRLLSLRTDNEPVPVKLQVSSWDPSMEGFHTWLAFRLQREYDFLASEAFGRRTIVSLIQNELILPVLDGLDELPEVLRAQALDVIDRWHGTRPIILTSRTEEFESLVAHRDQVFPGATVLEIEPVTGLECVEFLRTLVPSKSARWEPLFDALVRTPAEPCALALSTPLMISMARYIYGSPRTKPGDLANLQLFPEPSNREALTRVIRENCLHRPGTAERLE